jgi:outer membrane biosynthesis protein TonB
VTGFIKGLFRSKSKTDAELSEPAAKPQPAPKPQPEPKPQRRKAEAYYLNADDAKTYGDIDYMRSAKAIRRTFPKTKDGKTPERIETISSLEKAAEQGLIPTALNTTTSQTSAEETLKVAERRKADSSMDMFRNMARDIRKPK